MRILVIHHEDWALYWRRASSRRKHRNLGSLDPVIRAAGFGCDYHEIAIGQPLRGDLGRYSHVIMLGGNMSAYDDGTHGFLRDEMRLIEQALSRGLPVLGICLGAQILARVHGARAYPGLLGAEVGWHPIRLTEPGRHEPLLGGFPAEGPVFQCHADSFDLPAGATRLATSQRYENQAFRIGRLAWAVQFHLEADAALIRSWLRDLGRDGQPDPAEVLRDTGRLIEAYMAAASVFLRGFLGLGGPALKAGSRPGEGFPGSADDRESAE